MSRPRLRVPALLFVALLGGTACRRPAKPLPPRSAPRREVARVGFAIQAGAFSQMENAARLAERLQQQGLDATWFAAKRGLYKVRIGSFPTREAARSRAERLVDQGTLEAYFIVAPEEMTVARRDRIGEGGLREELVKTALAFEGSPYLWGGTDARTGFDCSGLTRTVYQLHGLDLPRSSAAQYEVGSAVDRADLRRGDLLFFDIRGGGVSHVGLYLGDGIFIHAPSRGKSIRQDRLDDAYFRTRYVGARSYV